MIDQDDYLCPDCRAIIADADLMRCPHCFYFFGSERKMVRHSFAQNTAPGYLDGLKTMLKKLHRGKSSEASRS